MINRIILFVFVVLISFFFGTKYQSFIKSKNELIKKDDKNGLSIKKNRHIKFISNTPSKVQNNLKRKNFLVDAVNKASSSIVFIGVTQIKVYRNPFFDDPFFRQFFPPYVREYKSMGSGVIVTTNGYIVTNYHVVENANKIEVHLQNGKKYYAELKGADPYTDLAVIKIKGKSLPAIKMCPNNNLYIGEWSIAIGNPFGGLIQDNKPSVTVGVISAVKRQFTLQSGIGQRYTNMIQTDAAINPGNSGGALINCHGELIGINTFIFSQNNGGSVGIGFAIPVERVRKTLKEIIKYGKIRPFDTGLSVQDINPIIARSLGFKYNYGVLINNVARKSPGKKAGLKTGDVILKVNNYKVLDKEAVTNIFKQFLVGDTVDLLIFRDRKTMKIPLHLEPANN